MTGQARNSGASDWLLGAVKQNPEGLLLLAAGCALLLRTGSSGATGSTSRSYGEGFDTGGLRRTAEGATRYASDIAEQTRDAARSYASSAAEYVGQVRQDIGQQSERVVRQAQSTAQSALDRVLQDQPLIVAFAGLVAGAAIAAAFPATQIEKETLGPVGEQVTDAARRAGEQVKEAAGAATEKLKQRAEERGLKLDGMKELAKEAAGAFSSSISGSQQGSGQSQQGGGGPQQQSGGSQQGG